jgi:hypothetical protein
VRFIAAAVLAVIASGTADARASARPRVILNDTYTCHFRRHGLVIIDTRDPGATITYRGKKYPVQDGSYFYVDNDDPKIMIMFGPRMRWWEWDDGDRAACARRRNLR